MGVAEVGAMGFFARGMLRVLPKGQSMASCCLCGPERKASEVFVWASLPGSHSLSVPLRAIF